MNRSNKGLKSRKLKQPLNRGIDPKAVAVIRNGEIKETKIKDKKLKQEKIKLRRRLRELNKRIHTKSKLPKSVQDTIPFRTDYEQGVFEIEEMKDGKRYSICIAFEDINYDTLQAEDASTILQRYTDLINAIPVDADISIVVNNRNVNLSRLKTTIYIKDREDELNYYRHEMNEMMDKNILQGNNHLARDRYMTISILAINPLEAFSKFNRI